jgi:transcription initiation factor TFIIE subunit beta
MEQKVFPKIIMHMKQRFQRNENFPISLEEILDELQIYDVNSKSRHNLDTQILTKNPKLEASIEDRNTKYTFKPYHKIRHKRDLINLIKDHQNKGLGGLLLDDIQESMTTDEFERIFRKPSEDIITLFGKGKKKILFYQDKNSAENIQVEEDIVKYWRDVAIEGLDEEKIDDYLEKQGIASMKDAFASSIKEKDAQTNKRKSTAKGRQSKKHNDHMGSILTEYNPDLVKNTKH